jgi:chorismate-pyruvate lyase
MRHRLVLAAFFIVLSACTHTRDRVQGGDSYETRVETLALMQTLNASILASSSATRTLEAWCRDHRMADEPRIVAEVVAGDPKPAGPEQRQRLGVSAGDAIRHRRVRLRCGAHVFSEADNWYVPSRLTPEMNRQLETTDTPFGKAVLSLEPYRRTVAASLLWSPLPAGWEQKPRPALPGLDLPAELFEIRAVLYTRDHVPFSEVHEVYQSGVLAFQR